MSAVQPPTVTSEDLASFHIKHFGTAVSEIGINPGYQEFEDDDGLGYYEDGYKRTLTDEQVAIFRHSEIQELLKEQRRLRKAKNKKKRQRKRSTSRDRSAQQTRKGTAESSFKHRTEDGNQQISYDDAPAMPNTTSSTVGPRRLVSYDDDVAMSHAPSDPAEGKLAFQWPEFGS